MTTTDQRIDLLWPQVHTLTLLGQLASFTQVAQRLGLSKAAVSQRITELERAVGQPLVQRTTRSVRLTDAARPGRGSAVVHGVMDRRDRSIRMGVRRAGVRVTQTGERD